jgi:hypothetical protein
MSARRNQVSLFLALAAALAALLTTPTPGAAQRGGFIIGIGAGPSRVSFPGFPTRTGKLAVATDFKIGYAPSETWSIYWSADSNFFSPDFEATLGVFGIGGLGVTRFLDADAPVSYVDGSLGFGTLAVLYDDGTTEQEQGLGFTLGTGWALSDVLFLDIDLLYSRISPDFGDRQAFYGIKASINVLSN